MEKQLTGKDRITRKQKVLFLEALKAGKTRAEILTMLGLPNHIAPLVYSHLLNMYVKSFKTKHAYIPEERLKKTEPYYKNEDDYGRIPVYKMSDFNEKELLFYRQMNIKIKMKKIERFKINTYLHLNAALMANLGTDSTASEKAFIVELKQKNLNCIKDISPEFFDAIDDGEK